MCYDHLEDIVQQKYDPKSHKNLLNYLENFQAAMSEMNRLGVEEWTDSKKKTKLLKNLRNFAPIVSFLSEYSRDVFMSYQETVEDLIEKCYTCQVRLRTLLC